MRYVLMLLVLAGCSSQVMLKNPKTNQVAKCESSGANYYFPAAATESCAKAYEQSGYVRVDSY